MRRVRSSRRVSTSCAISLYGPGCRVLNDEVLELPLDLLHTEPVGQRRVDLEGLGGDPALLGRRQRRQGAHVVQAIGELDQQDADVAGHRHDHLADVLGLRELSGLELQLVELRQAVDDLGDVLAELVPDPIERDGGVLDRVVQQRGLERGRVEPQVGEDLGNGQRVLDVGLTREPQLTLVGLLGDLVRGLEHLEVALRVVRANLLLERPVAGRRVLGAAAARQRDRPPRRAGGCAVPTVSSSAVSTRADQSTAARRRISTLSSGSA